MFVVLIDYSVINTGVMRETNMSESVVTLSPSSDCRTALQRLVDKSRKAVAKKSRSTVAARKAKLLGDLEGFDVERLIEVKDQMSAYVDLITMSLGDKPVLGEDQAFTLMKQALGRRDLNEFLDVCKDKIKEVFFGHLDEVLAAAGHAEPEAMNGSLEVPALGMKFCREGAGFGDPTINEGLLKDALGDRWKEVYEEQLIPAKKVYSLNTEKLWQLVENDPAVMEIIRDCLNPGALKSARMVLRTL